MSRKKEDIDRSLLESTYAFIRRYAIRGGVATEVGSKMFHLHLQGLLEMRYPTDPTHLEKLKKLFKDEVIKPRTGYTILIKPFGKGQEFSTMIGYITKDQGKIVC